MALGAVSIAAGYTWQTMTAVGTSTIYQIVSTDFCGTNVYDQCSARKVAI